MVRAGSKAQGDTSRITFWDLLTFDRMLTGPVIHLIYWAGLGVVVLIGFFSVGATVGVALREDGIARDLLALPVLVAGLLVCGALILVWRAFCEFYVAIFRISDDLHALREANVTVIEPPVPPESWPLI